MAKVGRAAYDASRRRLEKITASSKTLGVAESGEIYAVALTDDCTITLPSAPQNGTVYTFIITSTDGDHDLIIDTGSDSRYYLGGVLHADTNADSGSLGFYLNAATASSANTYLTTGDNLTVLSSSLLPMASLKNDEIWNVLLQRTTVEDASTHTYELYVARKVNDSIDNYWSGSLDVTGSITGGEQANRNFSTGSSQTSDNLHFGVSGFTGSLSEIKVWSGSLNEQNFELSVADHNSVVGPNINSFKDLSYWYRFKGNYNKFEGESATVKDVVKNNSNGDYSKTLTFGKGNWSIRKQFVTNYQFSPRGLSAVDTINKNKIRISKQPTLRSGGLSFSTSNIVADEIFDEYGDRKRQSFSNVKLSLNPTNIVNKFINYHVLDKDLGELLGDPSSNYQESYSELSALRLSIFNQYDGFTGINQYMRNLASLVPTGFWQAMSTLSPAGVKLSGDFVIESDILSRNKHPFGVENKSLLHEKYQKSTLNPNEFEFRAQFTRPNLTNSIFIQFFNTQINDNDDNDIDLNFKSGGFVVSDIDGDIDGVGDLWLNNSEYLKGKYETVLDTLQNINIENSLFYESNFIKFNLFFLLSKFLHTDKRYLLFL